MRQLRPRFLIGKNRTAKAAPEKIALNRRWESQNWALRSWLCRSSRKANLGSNRHGRRRPQRPLRISDGIVAVDLSVPKEMGGPGKPVTATPEHLFAAGYAACFGGAIDFVAKQHKKDASKAIVTCAVSIGPREGGGFGLSVKMHIEDKSMKQAELVALSKRHTKHLFLSTCHAQQRGRRIRRGRRVTPYGPSGGGRG